MRSRVLTLTLASLLTFGPAVTAGAQSVEDTSALRISYQNTTVECQMVNDTNTTQSTTLTFRNQAGMVIGTPQNFPAVPPLGIARATVSSNAMGLGFGSSVWCRASDDLGEISLCLWGAMFTPTLCVTNDD